MLYVLYGPDTHARKEAFDKLKHDLDPDGALATNTTTLDASKSSPQEVLAACDTVPFLGGTRLVVLEGALTAAGKSKKSRRGARASADDEDAAGPWSVLAEYAPRLPETTTLVLIDGEAPKGGLIDALKPYADVREFRLPDDKQLPSYVMNRAKHMGLKLDAPAAKLLAELIGNDAWMLASELDKLQTYAAGDVVRERDVHALVNRAKERKNWELAGAVIDGSGAKAAKLLQELVEDGQPLPVLLSTIVGRYRRIAIAKSMLEAGESDSAIRGRLKITNPNALPFLLDEVSRHSWPAIRRAYALAIQAEEDVKRGLIEEQLALELYVQAMSTPPKRPAASARAGA